MDRIRDLLGGTPFLALAFGGSFWRNPLRENVTVDLVKGWTEGFSSFLYSWGARISTLALPWRTPLQQHTPFVVGVFRLGNFS